MARIVIVDDVMNTRVMLQEYLEDLGHDIVANFDNGLDAVNYFNDTKHFPDLVILDYNIKSFKNNGENYTGIDLMKDIRKIRRNIVVIFLSAFAEKEVIKKAVIYGANDFVVKPFKGKDLEHRIDEALLKAG